MASGSPSDADQVETLLSSADCAEELVVSDLGPVIGAHTGPSTIGMAFQLARWSPQLLACSSIVSSQA